MGGGAGGAGGGGGGVKLINLTCQDTVRTAVYLSLVAAGSNVIMSPLILVIKSQ